MTRTREKDRKYSFRLPTNLMKEVKVKASITGVSAAEYIRSAINARLHSGKAKQSILPWVEGNRQEDDLRQND